MYKEDPRRWNNFSLGSHTEILVEFWSVWLPRSKGGGKQSQKCNLGPSALSTGDLSARKILGMYTEYRKHLALAVFRRLRSSSLHLNGVLKISVDRGSGGSKLGYPP